jgi:hypothetical protein
MLCFVGSKDNCYTLNTFIYKYSKGCHQTFYVLLAIELKISLIFNNKKVINQMEMQ